MSKEIYEIERKFLVKEIPNNLQQYKCYKIKQGYISTNPTIRLRQRDNEYILTIKSSGIIKNWNMNYLLQKNNLIIYGTK